MNEGGFTWEFINQYNGTMTPTGEMKYDLTTAYFFRELYERAMSVFDWTIPEAWSKSYFINVLYGLGYIGIIPTAKYGVIPQISTLTGYGLYLQPTKLLVAQPLVEYEGRIGEDCEIIRLTPDYRGITDIIDHYANKLSECNTSLHMAIYNSRLAWIAMAKNKAAAETLKVVLEKVSSGEPAVIVDKLLKNTDMADPEPIFSQVFDSKTNYIVHDILDDMQTIRNEFDKEIGIPVVDEKRERRIQSEVNALTADAGARIDTWERLLTESVERVNRMFNLNISFKRREVDINVIDAASDSDRTE